MNTILAMNATEQHEVAKFHSFEKAVENANMLSVMDHDFDYVIVSAIGLTWRFSKGVML